MGLQRYRCDKSRRQADGAVLWHADWIGGVTIARIDNCNWPTLAGEYRPTVYITDQPDTFFSIPAACHYLGVVVRGFVTGDGDGNLVFHHNYY